MPALFDTILLTTCLAVLPDTTLGTTDPKNDTGPVAVPVTKIF